MTSLEDSLRTWLRTEGARLSAQERWRPVVDTCRENGLPLQASRELWELAFADWDASLGPVPIWCPTPSEIADSNVGRFCQRHGLADFSELHSWSIEKPVEFWAATLQQLAIPFRQPFHTLLEQGPETHQTRWLAGGSWNIVEACLPELLGPTSWENQPAIVFSSAESEFQVQTRAELAGLVKRAVAVLQHCGLQGTRIAMMTPMTPACVAIYLAIIYSGGTVVSIADSFSAREIRRRMDLAECRTIVTYDQMSRAGRTLPLLQRVHEASDMGAAFACLVLSESARDVPGLREKDRNWDTLFAHAEPTSEAAIAGDADSPINLLFSSGTTGEPKVIPWTHLTPIKCAADAWFHHDLQQQDVVAWPTNLGWMMGPWLIFASLINRAAVALYHDAPVGFGFGNFVQQAGVTMLGLVPSMVKSWRATGDMEICDWSQIRCFSSTGESSNADDYFYLSWLAGFKPIIEYCGGTEIGGGYITSSLQQCNAPATFSTPALGIDVVILDQDGQASDEGELFLIPPSIGLSQTLLNRDHKQTYYSSPFRWKGRMLRQHGDHFRRLPGGYYEAGGRADDTMNLGGIKVSSIELERAINSIPGVRESAAVAANTLAGPSQLQIFLVLDSKEVLPESEWRTRCNQVLKEELNPLFRVAEVQLLDKLPRTASNKIMRRLLRDSLK